MIMSEIGRETFTRSLLDTGASINILPKVVFDCLHVGDLQPFLIELCLADGLVRKLTKHFMRSLKHTNVGKKKNL